MQPSRQRLPHPFSPLGCGRVSFCLRPKRRCIRAEPTAYVRFHTHQNYSLIINTIKIVLEFYNAKNE
ncbi:protein of unknown function [Alcaligenes faecalis subsp. faecalis]|nr:protein of unknown function [Alcaligenes faecalis subsp. faecalis]